MGEAVKHDLKAKLQQHLAATGTISEADVAVFSTEDNGNGAPENTSINADTSVPSVDPGAHDPVNKLAGDDKLHTGLQAEISAMGNMTTPLAQARKDVTITPDDKEAFIQAIITGDRMYLKFDACGGAMKLIMRSRTLPETQAIIAQLRYELDDGAITTNLDYSVRLRAMLMAAQVEDVRGTLYPTLASCMPLRRTQDKDKVTEPGWLPYVDRWAGINEGLHAIIWNCVWEFETKYWAMVEDAKNQDFWSPEASISE